MLKHFFRRKNYLVRPRFQLSLTAATAAFLLLYSALVAFLILYPIAVLINPLPVNGLTPEVKKEILSLPHYIWPLILILALVAAVQVILLSHRISGPSFRLERAIREMAAGQYQPFLTLRKGDCLQEVAESLALLADTLHQRRQTFLEELGQLRTRLEQHADAMRRGEAPTALQADLERMLQQVRMLEGIADGAGVLGEGPSGFRVARGPIRTHQQL